MIRNNKRLYESIMRDVAKIMKKYLNESENNNLFEFNISKFNDGSLEWQKLFKKIITSIKDINNDTNINIDCGKLGGLTVKFTNKTKNKTCNLNISMNNLSQYVKFDSDVKNEYNTESSFNDAVLTMKNIVEKIKNKF